MNKSRFLLFAGLLAGCWGRAHAAPSLKNTMAVWGYGGSALGNNDNIDATPGQVDQTGVLAGNTITQIVGGGYHYLVLCSDGNVAAWGLNATRDTSLALLGDPFPDTSRPSVTIGTPANGTHVLSANFTAGYITGTATDNVAVTSVEIYFSRTRGGNTEYWTGTAWSPVKTWFPVTIGSTGAGISTSWTWDTNFPSSSDLDFGDYRIAARALDSVKYGPSTARSFSLVSEVNPPHVTISNPLAGSKLTNTVFAASTVNGVATDDVAVNSVTAKFYRVINGVKEYWDGSAWGSSSVTVPLDLSAVDPTSITWSIHALPAEAQLPPGLYYVQASAMDTAGNSAQATRSFSIVIESTKPVVNIINPLPTVTVLATKVGSATFKGTATDNVKVMAIVAKLYRTRGGVKYFWNGTAWGTTSTFAPLSKSGLNKPSASWYLKPFPTKTTLDTGAYTLWVQATDASGNFGSESVTFNVLLDLTKPVVTVANPLANAKVPAPSFDDTTVHGTATDNDKVGQIKVKFSHSFSGVKMYWNGTTWSTASVTAPIGVAGLGTNSATWNLSPAPGSSDLEAGTYSVNVVATDPSGNASASVTRNFTIIIPASGLKAAPSGASF